MSEGFNIDILREELADDLQLLSRDLGSPDTAMPSPIIIRSIFAPILRKWVSDDGMRPFHDEDGKQTFYTVYDHQPEVKLCKLGHFSSWTASLPVMNSIVGTSLLSNPLNSDFYDQRLDREVCYNFKSFRVQKMAFLNDRFVNRAQCVRFTADKMGGTHTQAQARHRPNDPVEFLELTGAAVEKTGNCQLMAKAEYEKVLEYKADGRMIYSLMHLVVLDTARRFVQGVQ